MISRSLSESADLGEEVFNLLKRRGPLCASQLSVEIGVSLKKLEPIFELLHSEGSIEPRPDHDRSLLYEKSEEPWGLPRPSLFRRKAA